MTVTRRVELLEQDRERQSLVLTGIVETVGRGFTPEQLGQIRSVIREELGSSGLRIEGADDQDAAREDFRFLRRLRRGFDGASTKVGGTILIFLIGLAITIFGLGFWQWVKGQ